MQDRIHLSIAHLSGREAKYIREAFDTNWVTTAGFNLDAFEKDMEIFLNLYHPREAGKQCSTAAGSHVLALNSGTAAIHLGLVLLGVETGDEVICQSFTYTASTNPVYYLGAKPVFVDSEPDTWNMSPCFLEKAIKDRIKETGKKPKAIIAVHLFGMPVEMDRILQIAENYEIPVLEDAAEALGSIYKGVHCGTFGELAALSFNGNKIITTSGGGALLSKNEGHIKRARFL